MPFIPQRVFSIIILELVQCNRIFYSLGYFGGVDGWWIEIEQFICYNFTNSIRTKLRNLCQMQ